VPYLSFSVPFIIQFTTVTNNAAINGIEIQQAAELKFQ